MHFLTDWKVGNPFRSLAETGLLSEDSVRALSACHDDLAYVLLLKRNVDTRYRVYTRQWLQIAKRALTHVCSLDAEVVLVTNTQVGVFRQYKIVDNASSYQRWSSCSSLVCRACSQQKMCSAQRKLVSISHDPLLLKWAIGKEACFKAAMERFGDAHYISVGDGYSRHCE